MVLEAGGSRPLVHPNKICCFSVFAFDLLEWRSVIAPLAQLVEQRTLNPQVLGSNPRGSTIVIGVSTLEACKHWVHCCPIRYIR